jgi:hypothetical protein
VIDAAFKNAEYSLRGVFEGERQAEKNAIEERRKTDRLDLAASTVGRRYLVH